MRIVIVFLGLFLLNACLDSSTSKKNKSHSIGPEFDYPNQNLVLGTAHSCLLENGTVKCWGTGPIGVAGQSPTVYPVDVGLAGVKAISSGYDHVCVITSTDTVQCWGANTGGQLGNGSTTSSPTPANVVGLTNVKQISTGKYHSCALLYTETVKCWGKNARGEVGNNSTTIATVPQDVIGLTAVKKIAAGGYFNCAIVAGNSLSCWGSNFYGEAGAGVPQGSNFLVPTPFSVMPLAKNVSLGAGFGCILTMDDTIKCWGDNSLGGQLGHGSNSSSPNPVDVLNLTGVTKITTGQYGTCAYSDKWYCWGQNSSGSLGDTSQDGYNIPNEVKVAAGISSISVGGFHSCGYLSDGQLGCWGNTANSRLGPYAIP